MLLPLPVLLSIEVTVISLLTSFCDFSQIHQVLAGPGIQSLD